PEAAGDFRPGIVPEQRQGEHGPYAPKREYADQQRSRQGQRSAQGGFAQQPPARQQQQGGNENRKQDQGKQGGQPASRDAAHEIPFHVEADACAERRQHQGIAEQKQDRHEPVGGGKGQRESQQCRHESSQSGEQRTRA